MAGLSLLLAMGIYLLIPSQVSHEAIPGTGDYVKITPTLLPLVCVTAFGILGVVFLVESLRLICGGQSILERLKLILFQFHHI